MKRRGRVGLIFLGVLTVLALCLAGLMWSALRQERLNRALIAAVKRNDTNTVVSVLARGANANAHDEHRPAVPFWRLLTDRLRGGKPKPSTAPTPLMLALMWKDQRDRDGNVVFPPENIPLIRALIEHGADPNSEDEVGQPPLYFAIMDTKVATIHFLLAHGADVKKYEPYSHDPLVEASIDCREHPDVLQDLLDHGANVNQRNSIGDTALLDAIAVMDVAAVRLLLAHHADVTLRGWRGFTPLAYAMQYPMGGFPQIARMLKQAGAKK